MNGKTPLYDGLISYQNQIKQRHTMPGHGNCAGVKDVLRQLAALTPFDVTETPLTGDLFAGEGIVAEAEQEAANLYGCKSTAFSAGGATLCVNAALLLAGGEGGKVLVHRRSHRSVLHSMILLDQKPIYLYPEGEELDSRINPEEVDRILANDKEIRAVIITSPSYYGIIERVEEIAAVCHRHKKELVVDNSHGAHLIAFQGGRFHPIKQGTDYCIDSAHKTLPCFTGGALLHSRESTAAEIKKAMRLFGSSSPSYLILASIDLAVNGYCKTEAAEDISRVSGILARAAARIEQETPLRVLCGGEKDGRTDPIRLTLDAAECSVSGKEILRLLLSHGIAAEMADERAIVLLSSPLSQEKQIHNLAECICSMNILPKRREKSKISGLRLKQAIAPRNAYFAPKCRVSVGESIGKICGEDITPYPPGIPLVAAGEIITQELAERLLEECDTVLIISEKRRKTQ